MTTKLTQKEWEEWVRKALAERKFKEEHGPAEEKNEHPEMNVILQKIRNYISIPIMIGGIAVVVFYFTFGGQLLFRKILEWSIAATLFATLMAWLSKRKK